SPPAQTGNPASRPCRAPVTLKIVAPAPALLPPPWGRPPAPRAVPPSSTPRTDRTSPSRPAATSPRPTSFFTFPPGTPYLFDRLSAERAPGVEHAATRASVRQRARTALECRGTAAPPNPGAGSGVRP